MKNIEFKNLKKDDLENDSEFFVFHNGFRIIIKIQDKRIKLIANDELLDHSFSQKDIELLIKNFQIINPILEDTWRKNKTAPFHDNNLLFEINNKNILIDLIKFIFEKIYKISE